MSSARTSSVNKTGELKRVVRTLTGKRIYDLQHTCLTNWLNSGVPTAQVAEWAGNSVPVLLATYVKCISGWRPYRQRIEETLAITDEMEADMSTAAEDVTAEDAAERAGK